jgi:hypothetical protein
VNFRQGSANLISLRAGRFAGFSNRPVSVVRNLFMHTNAGAAAMPPTRANPTAGAAAAAEFEFCELCRRNHDQGRRHRYLPAHRAALAAALTRFRSKLSDLRRAVLHGAFSSSHPPRPRLWCPFCSTDLVDLDSPSAWYSLPTAPPFAPRVLLCI